MSFQYHFNNLKHCKPGAPAEQFLVSRAYDAASTVEDMDELDSYMEERQCE